MVVKKLIKIELGEKFMQVVVDVKCMHTNYCGFGLSGFGDIAIIFGQIFLLNHGI